VLSLENPKWGAGCLISPKRRDAGMDRILNASFFFFLCKKDEGFVFPP